MIECLRANNVPYAAKMILNKGGFQWFDLYVLGFFSLKELSNSDFEAIMVIYRDAALIKALYFRLFLLFNWLKESTAELIQDSPTFN